MTLAKSYATIAAYPLGKPDDGRERYGMTPEQAALYRWLIDNRPHDRPFAMEFREIARKTVLSLHSVHERVTALVERGWLTPVVIKGTYTTYAFVHPIMRFGRRR